MADWFYSLGDSDGGDLAIYAELFVKNNITGRRLFLLTGDDLLQIGVLSVGHRREIMVMNILVRLMSMMTKKVPCIVQEEIEKLRQENYRLLHFPPLSKVLQYP